MATIGLLLSNPRTYYRITKLLKSHNIVFVSLTPNEKLPSDLSLVITTKTEGSFLPENVERLYVAQNIPNNYILGRIMAYLQGVKGKFEKLIIGIDPGFSSFGIAVLGDDVIVETANAFDVQEAYQKILKIAEFYEADEYVIKIGSSESFCRSQLLSVLLPFCDEKGVVVEEVDEARTSSSSLPVQISIKEKSKDVLAAIHIALREGVPLQEYTNEIKDGEIKQLQEKSRKLTNGKITISRYFALQVAEGKLSLEDALRLQQGNNCAK
ncbi:MAG: hypothetical protein ACFFCD_00895 [Promethearchaeota archaeon]